LKILESRKGVVLVTAPILVLVVIWVLFGFGTVRFAGSSGLPALKDNEWLIYSRATDIQRGQFLLFWNNGRGYPALYVKRVVGLPGDEILMVRGKLSINGQVLEETEIVTYWKQQGSFDDCSYLANSDYWFFRAENPSRPESPCPESIPSRADKAVPSGYKPTPYVVPENSYFVMGDNRSPGGSEDSRAFGAVSEASIRGVLRFVGFPPRVPNIPEAYKAIVAPK
jgi:signal peptidase I